MWCWCQHRSLGLNQSLWTCIRSIQIQPWEYPFCLEFSGKFVYYISYSHPDPQLPFYCYTSDHDCYYEGERPSFNKPSSQRSRLETLRPVCREQMSAFISGWVSLVVNDSQFADSFINFVLHFHLHQHYSNISTVRNLLKLCYKNSMQQHNGVDR